MNTILTVQEIKEGMRDAMVNLLTAQVITKSAIKQLDQSIKDQQKEIDKWKL